MDPKDSALGPFNADALICVIGMEKHSPTKSSFVPIVPGGAA